MVQLISAGTQDAFLTGSPKRTYFQSVYYRRTPFFLNAVQVPFIGDARFGEQAICRIPQTGDIITGISLQATLPRLGTPSGVYYYVNQLNSFGITVNGVTTTVLVPADANTGNLSWLNVVPGLSFDENLTITATQSSILDPAKTVTVVTDNVNYTTYTNDSVTFKVSTVQTDFEELVKGVEWPGLLFGGYDGINTDNGFLSRLEKFRTPLPMGQTPSSITRVPNLQSNAGSNVYGETFTFTFGSPKSFTELYISAPVLVQSPGWIFVFGSNDGTNWAIAGPVIKSTVLSLYGSSFNRYRIVVASTSNSDSFKISSIVLRKSTSTAVLLSSQEAADLLCRDYLTFSVNGTNQVDTPLRQSPAWSYSTEQNISYVSNAGNVLIEEATLKIGGQTIKRTLGEYMTLRQDIDVPEENQIGLCALVGKNDTQLVTEPKKYLVPLDFVENIPVCSLDRHDIEIHMIFSQFSNLLQYSGLGEFSKKSYSNVSGVSAQSGILIGPTRLYTSGSSNITLNNGSGFSNVFTGVPSGQIRNLYSNLFVFNGTSITKDNGTTLTTGPGKSFGSDTISNLYVFNQSSNIYYSYDKYLTKTGNAITFNGPPGYVNATIGYTDTSLGMYRRVTVPLRITSTSVNNDSSIVQIYSPSAGEYYANALVPWVNEIIWDADYNANAYYSNLFTNQLNLNSQTTSNTAANQSLDYNLRWSVSTDIQTVYTLPGGETLTDTVFVSGGSDPEKRGQPDTWYEGFFTKSLTYVPNKDPSDPYTVNLADNAMYSTFVYSKTRTGQWKTTVTSDLSGYLVQMAWSYPVFTDTSNVLTNFQSITYTGVDTSTSNAVITYILPGGMFATQNVTNGSTFQDFGPDLAIRSLDDTVTQVKSDYVYSGTNLTISGCAVYSVTVNGVPQTHIPLGGFSGTRTFLDVSFPAVFDTFVAVSNSSGRIDDRTTWSSDSTSVTVYGLGSVNLPNKTPIVVNTITDITSQWENGLIVLSSSTPWQSRLFAETVYFTAGYWKTTSNIWPLTLRATFYDSNNVGTTITGTSKSSFGSNLLTSGYATFNGSSLKYTFTNCTYFTCSDPRSQKVLGIVSSVVPVTYYDSTSNVYLSPGGSPNFSQNGNQLSNISGGSVTDEAYNVYSACNSNSFLVQVLQNGTVNAINYDGSGRTANQALFPSGLNIVSTLHESYNVYWVSSTGTIVKYNTKKEFGAVGSMSVLSQPFASGVKYSAVTNRYAVVPLTTSNVGFVDVTSGKLTVMSGITVPTGPLVWDGARYLYFYPPAGPDSNVLRLDTILYTDPTFVNASMLVEYALVSEGERAWFKSIQNDHLMKQLQVSSFLVKAGTTEQQFDLGLKNLVTELLFTIDDDGLEAISLYFNGIPIIDYDDAGTLLSLSKIQPYEYHLRVPDRPFCMYSFAKFPNKMAPSGFVNMSRIVDQVISVRFTPSDVDRTFTVWADSYNVIRFRDGLAGMLYDYSTQ
jgi:hypothetical protein